MIEALLFYSTTGEYGCFSNFYKSPIKLDGKTWPTVEHYFQAQKFKDVEHQKEIRKANTPMIAARMGRDRKKKLRQDWESAKVNVMTDGVRAKFTQHEELKKILLETGERKIVEHTENDSYWADGGDGSGKNMLGIILMCMREELRGESGK